MKGSKLNQSTISIKFKNP